MNSTATTGRTTTTEQPNAHGVEHLIQAERDVASDGSMPVTTVYAHDGVQVVASARALRDPDGYIIVEGDSDGMFYGGLDEAVEVGRAIVAREAGARRHEDC